MISMFVGYTIILTYFSHIYFMNVFSHRMRISDLRIVYEYRFDVLCIAIIWSSAKSIKIYSIKFQWKYGILMRYDLRDLLAII